MLECFGWVKNSDGRKVANTRKVGPVRENIVLTLLTGNLIFAWLEQKRVSEVKINLPINMYIYRMQGFG